MTHEVNSRPLPPATARATGAAASPSAMDRVDRGLEGLWHLLSSMRVAIVIMLGIAILGVIGSLLMQLPAEAIADPARRTLWLDSVRPRYGGWTDVFNTLQWFEVFSSILFRLLVAALTISLIACSVHRIPGVIRTARNPRIDVGPAFFEHAPQHEAIVARRSAVETRGIVEGVFKGRRYRVLSTDDGTVHLYADRFRWAPASGIVGHLSLVLIMLGAIVGGMYGYRNPEFMVSEGETLPVAAQAGPALQVLDFTDKYDPATGRPIDYASEVVLLKDGQEVKRQTVRVNDPLRYDGLTFYQAFFGASAAMTVKDKDGNVVLQSTGVPLAYKTEEGRKFGVLAIPGTGYSAEISGTLGGTDPEIKPGQVGIGIYASGQNAFADSKVIDQGKPMQVGDLTVTFEREGQFTGLSVARDPGVPLIWIGSFLLLAGFVIRFMVPHKRVWARIVSRPNGGTVVSLATLTHKDVTAGSDFENVITDIRTALQAPAQA